MSARVQKRRSEQGPHRRKNLLTGEWILVSPHRTERPWQGEVVPSVEKSSPAYDPGCYLCPGNVRANGERNPAYTSTFAFTNDFAALLPAVAAKTGSQEVQLVAKIERGICRVVNFSPRHDLTLADMGTIDIVRVIETWREEIRNLARTRRSLLSDYLRLGRGRKERMLYENDTFAVLTPFWAVWPFEAMLLPRSRKASILDLTAAEIDGFADVLSRLTKAYDALFAAPFPYSAGVHQAPTDRRSHPEWHLHMHFYPPLLRSATVKKFMVGYELLAEPQRDITPEQSASILRDTFSRISKN